MDFTGIFNFLLIAGAVQGFVFNIATFLSRKRVEKPILYLNLFVFFLSLNNLQSWLVDKGYVLTPFFPGHFLFPWYLLIVPMFYAFLIHYLGIAKKKRPFIRLSILLFSFALFLRILIIVLVNNNVVSKNLLASYNQYEDAAALLYSLFIFYSSLRLLFRLQGLYRPILDFDDLNWVKRFLGLGTIVLFLWGVSVVLNSFAASDWRPYTYYPLRLSSSILIYWIGYQAFFRYVVLKDRILLRKEIRNDAVGELGNVIKGEAKISEKSESAFAEVNTYITTNQKFLDPNLGLESLAEELDMSVSNLSKLINTHSQGNFSDLINQLRVEEAKKQLSDTEFSNYTMVAIGLECGFNSKSTFYTAFKKFTGKTPTVYRKQQSK